VLIDGEPIGELACTIDRPDVRHAFPHHNQTSGFQIALPPAFADGRTHGLQFRDRLGTNVEIEHRLENFGCYEFVATADDATAASPSVP
jgi:hypothetical protein